MGSEEKERRRQREQGGGGKGDGERGNEGDKREKEREKRSERSGRKGEREKRRGKAGERRMRGGEGGRQRRGEAERTSPSLPVGPHLVAVPVPEEVDRAVPAALDDGPAPAVHALLTPRLHGPGRLVGPDQVHPTAAAAGLLGVETVPVRTWGQAGVGHGSLHMG